MEWVTEPDLPLVPPRKSGPAIHFTRLQIAVSAMVIVYDRGILPRIGMTVVCGMRPSAFETVATGMLVRDGVKVIW
jgi:hypothetical protein